MSLRLRRVWLMCLCDLLSAKGPTCDCHTPLGTKGKGILHVVWKPGTCPRYKREGLRAKRQTSSAKNGKPDGGPTSLPAKKRLLPFAEMGERSKKKNKKKKKKKKQRKVDCEKKVFT